MIQTGEKGGYYKCPRKEAETQKRPIKIVFFVLLVLVSALACNLPYIYTDVEPYPATYPPAPTRAPSLPQRWVEFERALASVLLGSIGNILPDVSRDQVLCEREFWGQKGEEVYNGRNVSMMQVQPSALRLSFS